MEDNAIQIGIIFFAGLGDFIVFCQFAKELYQQGKTITLICEKNSAVSTLAEKLPYFQEVIALDNSFFKRSKNMKDLQKVVVETVLVAPVQRHILTDLYALSLQSKRCCLPETEVGCSIPSLKKLVNEKVPPCVVITKQVEQDRYVQYLTGAGYTGMYPQIYEFEEDLLPPLYKTASTIRLGIFPGATGSPCKCWSTENFSEVITALQKHRPLELYFFGTVEERSLAENIMKRLPSELVAKNLCGKTNILEIFSVIRGCTAVLANDSGSAHLAIACKIPTVVIAGLWEWGRFYPNPYLPARHRVAIADLEEVSCANCRISKPMCQYPNSARCIEKVTVLQVLTALEDLLS